MAEQYLPGQQFTIQTYSQEQLSLAEGVHAPACVWLRLMSLHEREGREREGRWVILSLELPNQSRAAVVYY